MLICWHGLPTNLCAMKELLEKQNGLMGEQWKRDYALQGSILDLIEA